MSVFADELGITALTDEVHALRDEIALLGATKPFYKVAEVASILGIAPKQVYTAIKDGVLWKVDGLDTSTVLIPKAALEALQHPPPGKG